MENLRDNSDGTCNCRPLGKSCFFTDGFGNRCDCKCHYNIKKSYWFLFGGIPLIITENNALAWLEMGLLEWVDKKTGELKMNMKKLSTGEYLT